jgi:hypothetical protein
MVLHNTGTIRKAGWSTNTGVLTMTNTKTLMLAALTALTLGVGTAMAQSEVPAGAGNWIGGPQVAPRILNQVQSGSSDVERSGAGHVLPFSGNYGDLANPG